MIFALHRSIILSALVIAILLGAALLIEVGKASSAGQLLSWRGILLFVLNLLIWLMSLRPVLRVMHKITFAKHWWFPWLDGEWKAEMHSNWPIVQQMYESAKKGSPRFDPRVNTPIGSTSNVTLGSAIIKSSLFEISIEIRPDNSDKVSRTKFVLARWAKPERAELSYVYEQDDLTNTSLTDAPQHFGAGVVKYDDNLDRLDGFYWTNRRHDLGLNTAGTIILKRA